MDAELGVSGVYVGTISFWGVEICGVISFADDADPRTDGENLEKARDFLAVLFHDKKLWDVRWMEVTVRGGGFSHCFKRLSSGGFRGDATLERWFLHTVGEVLMQLHFDDRNAFIVYIGNGEASFVAPRAEVVEALAALVRVCMPYPTPDYDEDGGDVVRVH